MTHQDAAPTTATSLANAGEQTSPKPARPERIKPGYSLRRDLIRACKQIALDEERHVYEIIEEGLELVIAKHQKQQNS